MRNALRLALVASVLLAGAAWAEEFKIIRVKELAKLIDAKTPKLEIYDVNPPGLRESAGIIPGAHLLSGRSFDVEKELPPARDVKLVFYCANTH